MHVKTLYFMVLVAVITTSCSKQKISTPESIQLTEQSAKKSIKANASAIEKVYAAIESGDTKALAQLSKFPVHVRNQEWVTAEDGYGFILGPVEDALVEDKTAFMQLTMFDNISIEAKSTEAIRGLSYLDMQGEELNGLGRYWKSLDLFLYVRGMNDVEHVVVIGLDKQTEDLRAIYFN